MKVETNPTMPPRVINPPETMDKYPRMSSPRGKHPGLSIRFRRVDMSTCFHIGRFGLEPCRETQGGEHDKGGSQAPQIAAGYRLLGECKKGEQIESNQKEDGEDVTSAFFHQRADDPDDGQDVENLVIGPEVKRGDEGDWKNEIEDLPVG